MDCRFHNYTDNGAFFRHVDIVRGTTTIDHKIPADTLDFSYKRIYNLLQGRPQQTISECVVRATPFLSYLLCVHTHTHTAMTPGH